MVLGELNWYMQKHETRPPTYTIHWNKLKWIKDLNISCDTIKVLAENIGSKISDIPRSNISADISPRAMRIKDKINKWDYIKLKSFCTAKETIIKKEKGTDCLGEHICQ